MSSSSKTPLNHFINALRRPHRPPQSCQLRRSKKKYVFVKRQAQTEKTRGLTFKSDDKVDHILEFHFVYPHRRVVPFSAILADILADANTQLLNKVQWSIVGDFQVGRFPSGRSSESQFQT